MPTRFPIMLNADLSERTRLRPTAGSVTPPGLTSAGEASVTLAEADAAIAVHDWVSMYTQRGFAGVYRVTNVAQAMRKQVDVTMLHGIDILSDSVWAAQLDFSGTMAEYLAALLNQQTHLINGVKPWVLGSCADTSTVTKTINYDNLMALFEAIQEEGSAYYFTFDQSSFPWTVSYVALPSGPSCEFRLPRNTRSATVTYNDADLCTRLHVSVNVESTDTATGTTSTDTVIRTYDNAEAQAIYGIVVRTADIDTHDAITATPPTYTEADAWAADYLARRAAPSVQIQIEGDELAGLTGDAWDETDVGKLCRVALPAYGKTFEERVVSVTYPDPWGDPTHITVSLANTLPRVSESIASLRKASAATAKSARRTARSAASAKELMTWSQTVRYYGQALDGTGILTLYQSGIDMDASGGVTVYSLENGLQALYAGIQVNSRAISLKVSNGQVATQLAVECGNVSITGGNLVVDGYITSSGLATEIAGIEELAVQNVSGHNAELERVDTNLFYTDDAFVDAIYANGIYYGNNNTSLANAVYSFGTPTSSGGQISIPWTKVDGTAGTPINFNIADTAYYQSHVGINTLTIDSSTDAADYNDWDATAKGALSYGSYHLVQAKAKDNTTSNIKFYVPALKLQTKSITANGTYTADSGYDALGSVSVSGVGSGGVRTTALASTSNNASDYNDWTQNSGHSFSTKYAQIKISPNSGSDYYTVINASGTYNAGWNGLIASCTSDRSTYVRFSGKNAYNAALTRSGKNISGYIWLKNASGSWVRTGTMTITAATREVRVYTKDDDGDYHQYPAGNVIYTW